MPPPTDPFIEKFLRALGNNLENFLHQQKSQILDVLPGESVYLLSTAENLLAGGKRIRAKFCLIGASCAGLVDDKTFGQVVDAGSAIEVFHAAALVHDDLIDRSDSRRGRPAVHKSMAEWHAQNRLYGRADNFGQAAALLLGDLLIVWSEELFDRLPLRAASVQIWRRMRREVACGQFLDVLNKNDWPKLSITEALDRSRQIMLFKSGRYTVQDPLQLGASLNGAEPKVLEVLARLANPLGLAFQMRDDLLGVFGDSRLTGKPTGDDLREGKHTLLVGLTRQALDPEELTEFDRDLGCGQADSVGRLRRIIEQTGARQKAEELIQNWNAQALKYINSAPFPSEARKLLAVCAASAVSRDS